MNWKLNEQVCFLLYSSSRHVIKQYKELLDPLNLTYTQYVTMIALWEENHQTVSALGKKLSLDSGTLTPLLKKLEAEGRIVRYRDLEDERKVWIDLTDDGKALALKAEHVPQTLLKTFEGQEHDIYELHHLLIKLNQQNEEENNE